MTMISHHLDDEMLMRYSAGTLAEGWSLGVATHLSLCPVCRGRLAAFDSVGGYLLECEDSDADVDSPWQAMKKRLEAGERNNVVALKPRKKAQGVFPNPLAGYIQKAGGLNWRGLGVGAQQMVIPTSDPTTVVRLLKVPAGKPVPEHSHGGRSRHSGAGMWNMPMNPFSILHGHTPTRPASVSRSRMHR
jgi:putative transcriptional regulator